MYVKMSTVRDLEDTRQVEVFKDGQDQSPHSNRFGVLNSEFVG